MENIRKQSVILMVFDDAIGGCVACEKDKYSSEKVVVPVIAILHKIRNSRTTFRVRDRMKCLFSYLASTKTPNTVNPIIATTDLLMNCSNRIP